MNVLYVTETFLSIQGESSWAGRPSYFIRLSGCNLRCKYCDTTYSFAKGQRFTIEELVLGLPEGRFYHITITGGEPLLQGGSVKLMQGLLSLGFEVVLFTNGTVSLKDVPQGVKKVVDIKTPWCEAEPPDKVDTEDTPYFAEENFKHLGPDDEVKFVVRNKEEFIWARQFVQRHDLIHRVGEVIISPELGHTDPLTVWAWMQETRAPYRLGIQLHKCFYFDKNDRSG